MSSGPNMIRIDHLECIEAPGILCRFNVSIGTVRIFDLKLTPRTTDSPVISGMPEYIPDTITEQVVDHVIENYHRALFVKARRKDARLIHFRQPAHIAAYGVDFRPMQSGA